MLSSASSKGEYRMSAQTHLFLCLSDNYGVLLHDPGSGATAAIDAPEAGPVDAALRTTGWRLTDILVTHHHADHTAGISDLKRRHRCRVVAPASEAARIPLVDETVREGTMVKVGGLSARVLDSRSCAACPAPHVSIAATNIRRPTSVSRRRSSPTTWL
jgi:hydroxyacylglutathione hydrolase